MRSLACDGNNIWIATSYGLLLFDAQKKVFKHYLNTVDKQSPSLNRFDNDCNALLLDSKKRLWLGTVNGVWGFDIKKQTFEQYNGQQNDVLFDGMVNTVFEDHLGNIWIGCWSGGLKQVIPETHTCKSFNKVRGMPGHIMSIVEQLNTNNQYKMWVSDSLSAFSLKDFRVEHHDLKPIAEAASLDPRCLYISRDKLLWISTVKGVYILDPSRQLFKHNFIAPQSNITNQNPALFAENGRLWLGGDKRFTLKLFDAGFNLVKDYTPAIRALKGEYADFGLAVMNITPYKDHELLLSTTAGVLKLDKTSGKVSILCRNVSDSLKRTSGFINNVVVNKNRIWCFPWRRGVWQFDEKQNKFTPLVTKLPAGPGLLKGLNLGGVVQDKMGNCWIADLDFGVVKYTAATKKFERVSNKYIPGYSRVLNIRLINDKIWLIANSDIIEIDSKTNKTRVWSLPDGMNKYIYDYTNDDDGNIWIATRTGLVAFNTNNYSFSKYTEEDGLINNNMNGSLFKLPSGDMVYAGENYITGFKPADLLRTPARKDLLLTGVSTNDTDLFINNTAKINVPAGSEKILFKWALINYSNPLQNRYYSKLDKIDKDWNYAGNKGRVEYNGLTPGSYKFSFKAVTADGLAETEKTIIFVVEPHFWQTWWFQALVAMLLLFGVLLIIRNERNRERKKSALQLQLSALEMKALRAQMNPHFIFNALNSIQECIITKNTDTAYTYLSSFSKLVRMILENSEKQFITLADEIETLKLYLSVEKLRFDDTFEYQITVGPKIVDTSFIRVPAMIIQPFVENSLWHGLIHKKGEKKLVISFKRENNYLLAVIEDNGIGRDLSAEMKANNQRKKHSMGIKITEERLQLLETEASISVHDLMDDDGKPLGTKVTIVIPLEF